GAADSRSRSQARPAKSEWRWRRPRPDWFRPAGCAKYAYGCDLPPFWASLPGRAQVPKSPNSRVSPLEFLKGPTTCNKPPAGSTFWGGFTLYFVGAGPGQRNACRVMKFNLISEDSHGCASRQSAGWQAGHGRSDLGAYPRRG